MNYRMPVLNTSPTLQVPFFKRKPIRTFAVVFKAIWFELRYIKKHSLKRVEFRLGLGIQRNFSLDKEKL